MPVCRVASEASRGFSESSARSLLLNGPQIIDQVVDNNLDPFLRLGIGAFLELKFITPNGHVVRAVVNHRVAAINNFAQSCLWKIFPVPALQLRKIWHSDWDSGSNRAVAAAGFAVAARTVTKEGFLARVLVDHLAMRRQAQ